MDNDFATAMGRALDLTRAGSAMEATKVIQAHLNGTDEETVLPDVGNKQTRRRLGDVVNALASMRRKATRTAPTSTRYPDVPEGARYEAHSHTSPYGSLGYRLFVPSTREAQPLGILLMLHGCTQNANDFAIGTRMNLVAERENLIVVYADQSRSANQMGCWNWFRPDDQCRGAGEPASLADLVSRVANEYNIPQGKAFAAGLSAGGAMAAILGDTYPDVFSAIGVHSGLASGAASDVASAYAAMRGTGVNKAPRSGAPVRSIVFHGTNDTTVAPSNGDAVIANAVAGAPHREIDDRSVMGANVTLYQSKSGAILAEKWSLGGVAHAWSGGAADGSYTDPSGPDASEEMARFFLKAEIAE